MTEVDNFFDSMKELAIQKFKEKYVEDLLDLKSTDDMYIDDFKCVKAIEAFQLEFCDLESFTKQIKVIYGRWDCLTRATKYHQVEASIKQHICDLWDGCIEECDGSLKEWKNWSPISKNMGE
jgi:hypothetical protein